MSTRILIVEDDPDIAELVAHYLDKAGFTTERIASGRDALASIAAKPPDLVVLDLMLPQVDGLEICRTVRSDRKTAAIPIIAGPYLGSDCSAFRNALSAFSGWFRRT